MARSKKYPGVYSVKGKKGVSYGIDYIHPQSGERVRKILKNVTSEAEAFEIRSVEIADAARGALNETYGLKPKTKTVAFEDMLDGYLKWSQANKDSWETDHHRAKALREAFKGKLMSDINPFVIEKYKMARAKKVAKSTVNKEFVLGNQVFQKAIEWKKYNGENPFLKTEKFKLKKPKKPGSLTAEQVDAIMAEIKHPVKRDMVAFDFNTGWRISEIRNLKWEDVDLETGTAWIVDPKNGESVEIDLNDEAQANLSRQKRRGDHVFCHLNGKPFKTNIRAVVKNAAQRAGVELPPRKVWHILRRTWASMVLQSGGDVETLRELGNWKDYSMPMWYADAGNREHKRKVLNRLPKLDGRKMTEKGRAFDLSNRK
jgi:integrase